MWRSRRRIYKTSVRVAHTTCSPICLLTTPLPTHDNPTNRAYWHKAKSLAIFRRLMYCAANKRNILSIIPLKSDATISTTDPDKTVNLYGTHQVAHWVRSLTIIGLQSHTQKGRIYLQKLTVAKVLQKFCAFMGKHNLAAISATSMNMLPKLL